MTMNLSRKTPCVAAAVLVAACSPSVTTSTTPVKTDFLQANIDQTVNPGQDFFTYANGGWLKRNPIPNTESAWGIGNVVREQLYLNLRSINEQAAGASAPPGSDQQKIGDFWATAMDTAKAERLGIHPLDGELARIDAIRNANDALDVAFAQNPIQIGSFFNFGVYQDEKKSDLMSVHLSQGGLGLPDRDFYVNPDTGVAHIREEYVAHIARTLKMLGRDDAGAGSPGLPALSARNFVRAISEQRGVRRAFQLLQPRAQRSEGAAAALEARPRRRRRGNGDGARKDFREGVFPARRQEAIRRHGRGDSHGVPRPHQSARLDERLHQGARAAKACRGLSQGRLSRQMEGLLHPGRRPQLLCGEHDERGPVGLQRHDLQVRQARRPSRVGDDTADVQRLLQS